MTVKKLKRWIKRQFCAPENEKIQDRLFSRLMLTSVMGILICIICLSGLTWAWFRQDSGCQIDPITVTKFSVNATVEEVTTRAAVTPDAYGVYTLVSGKNYSVTLQAEGDATTGYCVITINGTQYHTTQMTPGDSLSFTVDCTTATSAASMSIKPNWMTYSGYSEDAADLIGQSLTSITVGGSAPAPEETPVGSPEPTETAQPSPSPSDSGAAEATPAPTETPVTTEAPAPTETPVPTEETPGPDDSGSDGAVSEGNDDTGAGGQDGTTEPAEP